MPKEKIDVSTFGECGMRRISGEICGTATAERFWVSRMIAGGVRTSFTRVNSGLLPL